MDLDEWTESEKRRLKKRRFIKDADVGEISLVKRPSAPGARFRILKRSIGMDDILRLVEKFMGHRIQKSDFSRNEIKNALRVLLNYVDYPSDIKKSMDTILAWAVAGEYGIEKGEPDLFPSVPIPVTDEQLQKMIDEEDDDEVDDDDDEEE